MESLWKSLMNDQTLFLRVLRGALALVAQVGVSKGWWDSTIAGLLTGGALLVGVGEPNPPSPPAATTGG